MKKFKKLFLVFTMVFATFLLSGCSNNNASPEKVATAMVKQLSEGDYENIGDLFYHDGYFTDEAFQRKIVYEDLEIKGNTKISVKEVGEEYTDEDNYNSVDVSISIDDNQTFILHTIEVEDKWYVYDSDFISPETLKIIVPTGAKILVDGEELSSDYLSTDGDNTTLYKNIYSSTASVTVPLNADVYLLPKAIKGGFAVQITYGDNVINDCVGYNSGSLDITTGSYKYNETDDYLIYDFYSESVETLSNDDKIVNAYLKDFLSTMYSNISQKKDFSELDSYFDSSYKLVAKTTYNDSLTNIISSTDEPSETYTKYYYDISISNVDIDEIKVFDDNNIAISLNYRVSYSYKYKRYSSTNTYNDYSTVYDVILLSKNDSSYIVKDAYKLVGGIN